MSKILEVRADNVDNAGGKGNNAPITTTWHDLSGNSHNGTLTNFPTNAGNPVYNTGSNNGWSNVNSVVSPCTLNQDTNIGANRYVDFGSLGSLPAQGSLEIWYAPGILDGGTSHRNLATFSWNSVANDTIRFEQDPTTNYLNAVTSSGGGTVDANSFGANSGVLNADTQIVLTWNTSTNALVGYCNGVQVFSVIGTGGLPANIVDFALFGGYNTLRQWGGPIRIARIYNTILTAAQVMTNYLADAHPQLTATVGTQATYTLPVVNSDTWTTTNPAWTISSGSTFHYTPIFEDGGTIITVPFVSGNGYGNLNLVVITYRDFSPLTRYSGNPIIHDFVSGGTSSPWTKKEEIISGTYYSVLQGDTPYDFLYNYTSPDLKTWTKNGTNPALSHVSSTWEDSYLVHPNVVKDGSTYRLFYMGHDGSNNPAIGLATSTDLLNWTKYGSNPVISAYETPGVWFIGTTLYLMAASHNGYFTVFTSTDGGHTWTNQGNVLVVQNADWDYQWVAANGSGYYVQDCFITINGIGGNTTYELCYSPTAPNASLERQRTGGALSVDGYVWIKYTAAIWKTAGSGTNTYDDGYVGDAYVIYWENYVYLPYSGIKSNGANGGGALATMQSSTTGLYLNITSTCYTDGNITYSASPNGLTATGITVSVGPSSRPDLNGLKVGFSELKPITGGAQSGNYNEPCVVPDPDNGGYVMFYSTPANSTDAYWQAASNPQGSWGSQTTLSSVGQKPYIVQDLDGNPVKLSVTGVGGTVYCLLTLQNSRTELHLLTATNLQGTWTDRGTIFSPQTGQNNILVHSMVKDDSGTLWLYYSPEPNSSDATYNYASRGKYATATTINGTWVDGSYIVNPSTNSSDWDYGWIGGMQVFRRPVGSYFLMTYNASNTRPTSGTGEPAISLIGYAYATSLSGPWTKASSNPVPIPTTYTGIVPIESTNLWRGFTFWDTTNNQWLLWCNTGVLGTETITYAILGQGCYNWTTITDDNFHRANSSTVGNNWTMQTGSDFAISSNTLVSTSSGGGHWITRPNSENYLETLSVVRFLSTGTDSNSYVGGMRGVSGSMGASNYTLYFLGIFQGGAQVKSAVGGSETRINPASGGNINPSALTNGHTYRMELAARATPGVANSTDVYASIIDETASSNVFFNSVVTDTTASLQSAGEGAIGYYQGSGDTLVYYEFVNYRLTQTDGVTIILPSFQLATVEPTIYTPGGVGTLVSLAVGGTNGTSISFTLVGFTSGKKYVVNLDGVPNSTVTADGAGHLTYSNSVWGASDTITVQAAVAVVPTIAYVPTRLPGRPGMGPMLVFPSPSVTPFSRNIVATVADSPTTTDQATRLLTLGRTATDTPSTTDSVSGQKGLSRSATDTPSTVDSVSRLETLLRSTADTPSTVDSITRQITASRSLPDVPSTSDSLSRLLGLGRTATDLPNTVDATSRLLTLGRTAGDTPSTAETAVASRLFSRTVTDTPSIADSVARQLTLLVSNSDTPSTTDSIAIQQALQRTATDVSSTTSSAVAAKIISRSTTDAPTTSDVLSVLQSLIRTISDTPQTVDSVVRIQGFSRINTDIPQTSDLVTANRLFTRSVSDAPMTSDSLIRLLSVVRFVADAPQVAESVIVITPHSGFPAPPETTWEESVRTLVWGINVVTTAFTPPLVTGSAWSSFGGTNPVNLLKRQAESAIYAYDFKNDAVVSTGDLIASVLSVTSTIRASEPGVTTNLTLGTPAIAGTQVQVLVSGGADGSQYELEFTILTVKGYIRVGVGTMSVGDEPQ